MIRRNMCPGRTKSFYCDVLGQGRIEDFCLGVVFFQGKDTKNKIKMRHNLIICIFVRFLGVENKIEGGENGSSPETYSWIWPCPLYFERQFRNSFYPIRFVIGTLPLSRTKRIKTGFLHLTCDLDLPPLTKLLCLFFGGGGSFSFDFSYVLNSHLENLTEK